MKFKRLVIAVAAVCLSVGAAMAQGLGTLPVVFDSIEAQVKNDPMRLMALTARFQDADTTLTRDELALVYYGHAFSPDYAPGTEYPDIDEAYAAEDGTLAVTLIEDALRKNPVSLPLLFKLYGCCATSQVPRIQAKASGVLDRIFMLCDMIVSTGTGLSPVMPWLVIDEGDINEILTKYYCDEVQAVLETSNVGEMKAVKARVAGIDEDVILYFDLALPRRYAQKHQQ